MNAVRRIASLVPPPLIARLNHLQFEHRTAARIIRPVAARIASGEGTITTGAAAGLRINASGYNAGYVLGTSEPEEQQWLARHLRVGDVFWDVGANIGFFSLLAARLVGAEGAVVAFEPEPEIAARLRMNIELNGFEQATVVNAAVSDRNGEEAFVTWPGRPDSSRLAAADERATTTVSTLTLDSFASDAQQDPQMIKLDVEGSELEALEGAMQLLQRARPTLLVEVHWLGDRFTSLVKQRLEPLGYSASMLSGGEIPERHERYQAILLPTAILA